MTSRLAVFIGRRLVAAAAFTVVVSSAALVLGRLAPGDAGTRLQMTGASEAQVARARAAAGFDRTVVQQVGHWVSGLARFDLGESAIYGRPVSPIVLDRAARTAELAGLTLLCATLVGVPIGILTGARPNGVVALVVAPISIAFLACPPVVGALALLFLALTTGWLSVAPGALAVPVLALTLPLAASIERLQAHATADALARTALPSGAARGVPAWRSLWVHVARQSAPPVLGVYGVIIGGLFSGSLAVEMLTAWPGLGRLTYEALVGRDLFLVAGCVVAGAIFITLGNLTADLLRLWIDPRLRGA